MICGLAKALGMKKPGDLAKAGLGESAQEAAYL
jgi:hypothetical protein